MDNNPSMSAADKFRSMPSPHDGEVAIMDIGQRFTDAARFNGSFREALDWLLNIESFLHQNYVVWIAETQTYMPVAQFLAIPFVSAKPSKEKVNHPEHYNTYKGLEIIDLVEQMNFNKGNAVKYIARAGLKDPSTEIEDLKKARWYINREILRLGGMSMKIDLNEEQ